MNRLKAAALAAALVTSPIVLHAPLAAQVTEIDVHMAESAIMLSGTRAAKVAHVSRVPSIGVIRLDVRSVPRFRNDSIPDVSEFRILAEKYSRGIAKLRSALQANPATRKALAAHGISVNRVVGVQISSSGALRLYLL
jgi:hypothetical protein